MVEIMQINCDYCDKPAEETTGAVIYPKLPKLAHLKLYACFACGAYVGTHKNSGHPLGRLANKELRIAKMQAHKSFDILWSDNHMTRDEAYKYLAKSMGIKKQNCHIGMFNENQCQQAINIAKAKLKQIKETP
mgnify:CR=1 FL=1